MGLNLKNAVNSVKNSGVGKAVTKTVNTVNKAAEEVADTIGVPTPSEVITTVVTTVDNVAESIGLPTSQEIADTLGIPSPLDLIEDLEDLDEEFQEITINQFKSTIDQINGYVSKLKNN
jgi:hypothetical protein